MAKLNTVKKPIAPTTVNYEGAKAFEMDAKTKLYTQVCSCLWNEPTFYDKNNAREESIINLIDEVGCTDPEWVMKLGVYAREQMYLRSVPVVILCEMAAHKLYKGKPKPWINAWGARILARADEVGEALAYYTSKYGKKIPNSLKDVIEARLNQLTEYEATKYAGSSRAWKLLDVINYIHPKPRDEKQEALFGYIIGKHKTHELLSLIAARDAFLSLEEWGPEAEELAASAHITWETAIPKFGNKKEVWEALNIPIMASVRNIRNMIEAGADLIPTIEKLTNSDIVYKSKMFPFRFWTAYKIVGNLGMATSKIAAALDDALMHSSKNIKTLDGRTLICIDHSGSMGNPMSRDSSVTYFETAATLGVAASFISQDNDIYLFGEKTKKVELLPNDSFIYRMGRVESTFVGHATHAHLPIDAAIKNKEFYDRIIIVSDMQCYGSQWGGSVSGSVKKYRNIVNPNVKVISIDVAGYGTAILNNAVNMQDKVLLLSGFSDRVFEMIHAWENSTGDATKMIDAYE